MLVENRQFLPTPPLFGVRKLDYLGYRMTLFAWSYVQPFWYSAGLWRTDGRTDRQTQDGSIYRA